MKVNRSRGRKDIMYRTKRLAGVAIALALLASLGLAASVGAQDKQSAEVQLTPSRGSGVSGTATLTDVEGGVKVVLNMQGLPEAGVEHINHIHGDGTCAEERAGNTAPVTIPLKTVVARDDGTGSAPTTIKDVTVAQLFGEDEERFILFHAKSEKGQGVPPGISCADLVPRTGNGGFDTLPASGGTPLAAVLSVIGAVLALGAVVSLLALRRLGA